MPKRIRFNAEPQHKLVVGKVEISGGKEGTVPDDVAEELAAADYVDVSIVDGSSAPRWPRSNAEIEELAAKFGIELPQPPPDGSKKVTYAEKVEALEAAGKTPADAAAVGATDTKE
jgi:hypothetical protein